MSNVQKTEEKEKKNTKYVGTLRPIMSSSEIIELQFYSQIMLLMDLYIFTNMYNLTLEAWKISKSFLIDCWDSSQDC